MCVSIINPIYMDVCKTDLIQAARLLREAATYIQSHARSAREADKARQMTKLSKKLQKKIEQWNNT